mgnify:FL=1
MKYYLLACLLSTLLSFSQSSCDSILSQSFTSAGPYNVLSIDESDGIRNGQDYNGATIFYPEGNQVNLASIVFVPGYSNTQFTIQNWGLFLASYGIVTMTIGTNTLLDSHIQRKDALLDALITIKQENVRSSSPLYNSLDTLKLAVGGFSKGGGGAQLAASIGQNIKAVIALYPWLENISAVDLDHDVPVLIVSGNLDIIAPPTLHADIHYMYTPETTKKLKYEIAFATHDPLSGPNAGSGEVGKKTLSWLQTFLLGDSCFCPYLLDTPSNASIYMSNLNCTEISTKTYNLESNQEKKILKIIDIFGREVEPKKNMILFYIYNDQSVKKIIIK